MEEKAVRLPRQDRSKRTKQQLQHAGLAVFAERGFHKTKIKEICDRADTAVGSFYAYYKNKMDLFLAVLDGFNKGISDEIQSLIRQTVFQTRDPKTLIKAIITAVVKSHAQNPGFNREIDILIHTDPRVKEKITQLNCKTRNLIEQLILQIEKPLRVNNLSMATFLIYRLVEDCAHALEIEREPVKKETLIDEAGDMIYRYLF